MQKKSWGGAEIGLSHETFQEKSFPKGKKICSLKLPHIRILGHKKTSVASSENFQFLFVRQILRGVLHDFYMGEGLTLQSGLGGAEDSLPLESIIVT